jgi:predicted nucleic acid-binding protein
MRFGKIGIDLSVVDANVWIATFVQDDVFHVPSSRWLSQQMTRGEPIMIPAIALAEVAGAISRRAGAARAGLALADMMATPTLQIMEISMPLAQSAANLATNLSLRGMDAIYAALAVERGLPLITWDNELLERAGQAVRITTPT